jgi:hypothetical protein
MIVDEEPALALSLGLISGSPSAHALWGKTWADLSKRVSAARGIATSDVNVNVVFQVPGEFSRPDFEGLRTGSFRRRDSLLMVQVTLPGEPPPGAEDYLAQKLLDAIDVAEEWAIRKRHATSLDNLRDIALRAIAESAHDLG